MNAEAEAEAVLVKAQWRALSAMAWANAFHFGAYELARSAISALFTSSHTFSSSSSHGHASTMMTLATGCVSPCSILLLAVHRTVFDRYGPQLSLRYTTMIYAISLSMAAVILRYCCVQTGTSESSTGLKQYLAQGTIIFIFIMKNSFVQLLASQHWSFITGILTTTSLRKTTTLPVLDSDRWTTIIAGTGSVVATLFGWTIEPFLNLFQPDGIFHTASDHDNGSDNTNFNGLTALLICAAYIMVLATVCSDQAYHVAHKYHFAPTCRKSNQSVSATSATSPLPTASLYRRAQNLFQNVPVLYILCYEVLLSQAVSTLISYMFISYTKQSIPQDHERASHTGKVYGRINMISGILQFAILPYALGRRRRAPLSQYHPLHDTPVNHANNEDDDAVIRLSLQDSRNRAVDWYWLLLPTVLGIAGIVMIVMEPISNFGVSRLNIVTASFSTMKILEYSLRVALIERVYVPLDDDERFLGKEIVGMIANRFGKSCSAIVLAISTTILPTFFIYAPYALSSICFVWSMISILLIQSLSKHKEKVE